MEKIKKSLHKYSNILFVCTKIGFVGSIVGVCLSICAMVCLSLTGDMSFVIPFGNGTDIRAVLANVEGNLATVWGTMAYALTFFICFIIVMHILMRLFRNIRDNYTPFTMENAGFFKKMAIWMIVTSVVPAIIGQSVGLACAVMMQSSFNGEFGNGFSVISVLVLFAMSLVFKYGCALQEESDTTL